MERLPTSSNRSGISHPLPNAALMAGKDSDSPMPAKPLVAFQPLVQPLLLRFRWHFDGDRNTNRIDKVSERVKSCYHLRTLRRLYTA